MLQVGAAGRKLPGGVRAGVAWVRQTYGMGVRGAVVVRACVCVGGGGGGRGDLCHVEKGDALGATQHPLGHLLPQIVERHDRLSDKSTASLLRS